MDREYFCCTTAWGSFDGFRERSVTFSVPRDWLQNYDRLEELNKADGYTLNQEVEWLFRDALEAGVAEYEED